MCARLARRSRAIHAWACGRPNGRFRPLTKWGFRGVFDRSETCSIVFMHAEARPRRRPTQSRAKDKVEAILDAADDLLRTTPVDLLMMRDIARHAAVAVWQTLHATALPTGPRQIASGWCSG